MSDEARLAELERRYRETAAPDDGARWLLARERAGRLAPERIDLAAALGDPAARTARGLEPLEPAALERLAPGDLEQWGRPVVVRALVAVCAAVADIFRGLDDRPDEALAAAERWAIAPDPGRAEAAREAALAAGRCRDETEAIGPPIPDWDEEALRAFACAVEAAEATADAAWIAGRPDDDGRADWRPKEFRHQVARALDLVLESGALRREPHELMAEALLGWALE